MHRCSAKRTDGSPCRRITAAPACWQHQSLIHDSDAALRTVALPADVLTTLPGGIYFDLDDGLRHHMFLLADFTMVCSEHDRPEWDTAEHLGAAAPRCVDLKAAWVDTLYRHADPSAGLGGFQLKTLSDRVRTAAVERFVQLSGCSDPAPWLYAGYGTHPDRVRHMIEAKGYRNDQIPIFRPDAMPRPAGSAPQP